MDSKHFQFHFYCLPDASKLNDTMRKIVLALILTIVYACNSDDENVDPCTQFDAVVQTISLPSACDARDASVTFETIGGSWKGLQHYELYDVSADPYQVNNIVETTPEHTRQALHEQLQQYFQCSGSSCP